MTNPFFKNNGPFKLSEIQNALNLKKATDLEIFTKLRDLKDNF